MNEKFITCNTSQISNEVEKAKSIIANRNINDIWSAMLLQIKDSSLTIKASDRNIFFESHIPIISESEFKMLVNGANLSDAIKALNLYQDIKITFKDEENKIQINGENEESNTNTDDSLTESTFPNDEIENYNYEINNENYNFSIELSQKEFKKIINKMSFAASQDESKKVLNGIYFTKDDNNFLTLVATNGHRMSIYRTEITTDEKVNFIVPVKTFNILKQLLPGEGMILLKFSDNKFYTKFNNYQIACSLISGNYPDYKSIMPKNQTNEAVLDVEVLKDRITRVNLYSDKKSRKVILTFSGLQLKLLAEDLVLTRKSEFFIKEPKYSYDGSDESIALNSMYLSDAINALEGNKVKINFNGGDIVKLGEVENENFMHLIMPMILN